MSWWFYYREKQAEDLRPLPTASPSTHLLEWSCHSKKLVTVPIPTSLGPWFRDFCLGEEEGVGAVASNLFPKDLTLFATQGEQTEA